MTLLEFLEKSRSRPENYPKRKGAAPLQLWYVKTDLITQAPTSYRQIMHPHDMNRIMHYQLISNAEAVNAHDLVDELDVGRAGVGECGSGDAGRHALVPLRSSGNANRFFGSEGPTAKEMQDGLGMKRTLTYDCDEPDYQYGTYGYSDGKENVGYFFSADVDLGNPTVSHQSKQQQQLYPLSMIYAGFETSKEHGGDDQSVAQLNDEEDDMPGVMCKDELELLDSTSAYTESHPSSPDSSSTLEVSSPSSEDSLFEVPAPKARATRRNRITHTRQSRKFYQYDPNGSPLSVASPPLPTQSPKEPKIVARDPRFEGDLYTPRFQRGTGECKEGFCGLCTPGIWLRIKQSSYWYHMNYHHGISATTGRPYEAPTDFHVERISRTDEQAQGDDVALLRISGTCGHCGESITISNKYLEGEQKSYQGALDDLIDLSTINLMTWYKHAQRCHRPTK